MERDLTLNEKRLPYLHLGARSRDIPVEEIREVYYEEANRGVPHDPYQAGIL